MNHVRYFKNIGIKSLLRKVPMCVFFLLTPIFIFGHATAVVATEQAVFGQDVVPAGLVITQKWSGLCKWNRTDIVRPAGRHIKDRCAILQWRVLARIVAVRCWRHRKVPHLRSIFISKKEDACTSSFIIFIFSKDCFLLLFPLSWLFLVELMDGWQTKEC